MLLKHGDFKAVEVELERVSTQLAENDKKGGWESEITMAQMGWTEFRVCISGSLSLSLSIYLSIYIDLYLSISLSLSVSLSRLHICAAALALSLSLSLSHSVCSLSFGHELLATSSFDLIQEP